MTVFDKFDREVFSAGQEIFRRGDLGDCAYLIEEGSVEVLKPDGEHRIKIIGKGELFGEIALIDYQPRTATVRAVERTTLIPILRDVMEGLLDKTDPVLRHLLLVILDRFRNRNEDSAAAPVVIPPEQTARRRYLQGEATRKLSLMHGMKRALSRDEFELYYQPIYHLADNKVAGFESLIRWHHPLDGLISPGDFLWIAEQTDLIHEVGVWVLDHACYDWKRLRSLVSYAQPFFSVNLSVAQLSNERLVGEIKTILAKHRIPPAELKLELTETIMVTHPENAYAVMRQLIGLGCTLALDDYGAGHAGLTNLQQYPLSTMKIDRAFIQPMLTSPQSLKIVHSSIALGHALGMDVVAEGIETEAVHNKLLEMKCEFGQGWYFGKPAPLADLIKQYGENLS